MVKYVIKYYNIDDKKRDEIVFNADDYKHARRLAKARMDRKPYGAVYEVVEA